MFSSLVMALLVAVAGHAGGRCDADLATRNCAQLVAFVTDHGNAKGVTKRLTTELDTVCGGTADAAFQLTRAVLRNYLVTTHLTYLRPMDKQERRERIRVVKWLRFVAARDVLTRERWLALIVTEHGAQAFADAFGRDMGRVHLTEGDRAELIIRLARDVGGLRVGALVEWFGIDDVRTLDFAMAYARPALLLDYLRVTNALDAGGVARIRALYDWWGTDPIEAYERAVEASATIEDLVLDPSIPLATVDAVVAAVFKRAWNDRRPSARPHFWGSLNEVPPAIYPRVVHVMTTFPKFFGGPRPQRLAAVSPQVRARWLRGIIDKDQVREVHFATADVLRDVPRDLAVEFLSKVARDYRRNSYQEQNPDRPGLFWRLIRRLVPRGFRDRFSSSTLTTYWLERDFAAAVRALAPADQLVVAREITSGRLLTETLAAATFDRESKMDVIYAFVVRVAAGAIPTNVLAPTAMLARVVGLDADERARLARHVIRHQFAATFALRDAVKRVVKAFRLSRREAARAILAEAPFGVMNPPEEVKRGLFVGDEWSNVVSPGSPFDEVKPRLLGVHLRHDPLVTRRQYEYVTRVTGHSPTLGGYLRALNPPGGPIDFDRFTDVGFLAHVLGLPDSFFAGALALRESQMRSLQTLTFALPRSLGERPLAALTFTPPTLLSDVSEFLEVLRRLRTAAQLTQARAYDRSFAVTELIKDGQDLPRARDVLAERIVREVKTALADDSFEFTFEDLSRLDDAWDGLDLFYVVLARLNESRENRAARPQMRTLLRELLNGRFATYKYYGDPNDPVDRTRATAQRLGLSIEAIARWSTARATAEFVRRGEQSPDEFRQITRLRRTNLIALTDQALTHARDAGLIADDRLRAVVAGELRRHAGARPPEAARALSELGEGDRVLRAWLEELSERVAVDHEVATVGVRAIAEPAIIMLQNRLVDAGALTDQIIGDLKDVLRALPRPTVAADIGDEAILVASTLTHPKSMLGISALVAASSCLDAELGAYVRALLAHVIDANLGIIAGYELRPASFETPADFARVRAWLTSDAPPSVRVDEVARVIVFSSGDDVVRTRPLAHAQQRRVVRLGVPLDGSGPAGLATERAYGAIGANGPRLAGLMERNLRELATEMNVAFDVPVRVIGTRSQGSVYSDFLRKLVEPGRDYDLGELPK